MIDSILKSKARSVLSYLGEAAVLIVCVVFSFSFCHAFAVDKTAVYPLSLQVFNTRTGLHYLTIQSAINANETLNGDTLLVDEGIYAEHVNVTKSLGIVGRNRDTTIVDSGGSFRGFIVSAGRVNISGFTVENARWAIYVESDQNRIFGNKLIANDIGIYLTHAYNNTVEENLVEYSNVVGEGIDLSNSKGNIIQRNVLTYSYYGIFLTLADQNVLKENTIARCSTAVSMGLSNGNVIYNNNLVNNTLDVENSYSTNNWSRSYPAGGNYWSSHNNTDFFEDVYQNETGSDAIADGAYKIDSSNEDAYPLAAMTRTFDAGVWNSTPYSVDVVSNSTISGFSFNPTQGAFLSFNITGINNTSGFCRASIPRALLWADDGWIITLDGRPANYTLLVDGENTYLYVFYGDDVKEVVIEGTGVIPEGSLVAISMLAMISSMSFVVKTRLRRKPNNPY